VAVGPRPRPRRILRRPATDLGHLEDDGRENQTGQPDDPRELQLFGGQLLRQPARDNHEQENNPLPGPVPSHREPPLPSIVQNAGLSSTPARGRSFSRTAIRPSGRSTPSSRLVLSLPQLPSVEARPKALGTATRSAVRADHT